MSVLAPVKGSMPVLMYCTPDQLKVDRTYQRDIDPVGAKLIERIARNWNWGLCQPLVIAKREDGSLFIVDGQHRWEAARTRGDIAQLPCVVVPSTDSAEEADAFVALNRERRPLSPFALFRAAVASGDPAAGQMDRIAIGAGIALTGNKNPKLWPPATLGNINALCSFHRQHGDAKLRRVFTAIATAWPGERLHAGATIFVALAALYGSELGGGIDDDLLIALLSGAGQDEWLSTFRARGAQDGVSRFHAAGRAMIAAYAEASADE